MNIKDLSHSIEHYLISMRRHFHENPETCGNEIATIRTIATELDKFAIPYVEVEMGGLVATIKGKSPGKTVLLRADCDALPMSENSDNLLPGKRPCVSKIPGVMHSCGHDAHTSMLLGAAKILSDIREQLEGTVILAFERGEEQGSLVYNLMQYFEDNNIPVDACFGIHVAADLPAGKIGIVPGPAMSGSMVFNVKLTGSGGHGSRPDLCKNPVDCFAAIVQALGSLRLNHFGPFQQLSYSIGNVSAGSIHNIIPETLTFGGTARSFDLENVGAPFKAKFIETVKSVAATYGCEADFDITGPSLPVYNDPELTALAESAIRKELGQDFVLRPDPNMVSESFAVISRLFPGVFCFLGCANPEKGTGAPHHNPAFDVDEDILKDGAASFVAFAKAFLESDIDTTARKWTKGLAAIAKEESR